jgi:hypothetical protein
MIIYTYLHDPYVHTHKLYKKNYLSKKICKYQIIIINYLSINDNIML